MIGAVSTGTSTMAGLKHTSSNWFREGYWTGANGRSYSMSLTTKGNKGWVFYQGSANIAKNSLISTIGRNVGYFSLAYSGYNFAREKSLSNGLDLGIGFVSIAFWEVGAVYGIGSALVGASTQERTLIQNNITNNVNPLYNVYSPSLGY